MGSSIFDKVAYKLRQIVLSKRLNSTLQKESENPNPEKNDEDNIEIKDNIKNNLEIKEDKNKNKNDEFDYNDEEQGIIKDLFLKDEILEDQEKNGEGNKDDKNVNNKKEEFDVKDSDFDNFPEDYNPEEEMEKKENKIVFNGVEIDANEKPDISGINISKEKRTSMQIEDNENDMNNKEMKPESMNDKIILDK